MKVEYSREFIKSVERLSGKMQKSVVSVINEVIAASNILQISNCKKIESLNNVYRIRIGDKRAFFVLHIEIECETVKFEYLVNRGDAYDKRMLNKLKNRDK